MPKIKKGIPTMKKYRHSFIPAPYYQICMEALYYYRNSTSLTLNLANLTLASCIKLAVNEYNQSHPKNARISKLEVRRYLLKYLKEDCIFE